MSLIYSRFFPDNLWGGKIKYLWECLKDSRRVVRYSWQRARRGWADCDVWNVDVWFCAVAPEMLRHLANNHQGYPTTFADVAGSDDDKSERWEKVLKQIAWDLEAQARYEEKWFGKNGLYCTIDREYPKQHEQCIAEEVAAFRQIESGLEDFKYWFFNLWD